MQDQLLNQLLENYLQGKPMTRPWRTRTPETIPITSYVLEKGPLIGSTLQNMARQAYEWYGVVVGNRSDGVVRDIILPCEQEISAVHVRISGTSAAQIRQEVAHYNARHQTQYVVLGWCHGHGNMQTFHSWTDDENMTKVVNSVALNTERFLRKDFPLIEGQRLWTVEGDRLILKGRGDGDAWLEYPLNPAALRRLFQRYHLPWPATSDERRFTREFLENMLQHFPLQVTEPVSVGFCYSIVFNNRGDRPYTELCVAEHEMISKRHRCYAKQTALLQVPCERQAHEDLQLIAEEIRQKILMKSYTYWRYSPSLDSSAAPGNQGYHAGTSSTAGRNTAADTSAAKSSFPFLRKPKSRATPLAKPVEALSQKGLVKKFTKALKRYVHENQDKRLTAFMHAFVHATDQHAVVTAFLSSQTAEQEPEEVAAEQDQQPEMDAVGVFSHITPQTALTEEADRQAPDDKVLPESTGTSCDSCAPPIVVPAGQDQQPEMDAVDVFSHITPQTALTEEADGQAPDDKVLPESTGTSCDSCATPIVEAHSQCSSKVERQESLSSCQDVPLGDTRAAQEPPRTNDLAAVRQETATAGSSPGEQFAAEVRDQIQLPESFADHFLQWALNTADDYHSWAVQMIQTYLQAPTTSLKQALRECGLPPGPQQGGAILDEYDRKQFRQKLQTASLAQDELDLMREFINSSSPAQVLLEYTRTILEKRAEQ